MGTQVPFFVNSDSTRDMENSDSAEGGLVASLSKSIEVLDNRDTIKTTPTDRIPI